MDILQKECGHSGTCVFEGLQLPRTCRCCGSSRRTYLRKDSVQISSPIHQIVRGNTLRCIHTVQQQLRHVVITTRTEGCGKIMFSHLSVHGWAGYPLVQVQVGGVGEGNIPQVQVKVPGGGSTPQFRSRCCSPPPPPPRQDKDRIRGKQPPGQDERVPLPWTGPGQISWGTPRIGPGFESLHRGRYAFCAHAGGLSCLITSISRILSVTNIVLGQCELYKLL